MLMEDNKPASGSCVVAIPFEPAGEKSTVGFMSSLTLSCLGFNLLAKPAVICQFAENDIK